MSKNYIPLWMGLVLLALLAATVVWAAPPTLRLQRPTLRAELAKSTLLLLLSPLQRSNEFQRILQEANVPDDQIQKNLQQFRGLPGDLQESILTATSSKWAMRANLPVKMIPAYTLKYQLLRPGMVLLLNPYISSIWPAEGSPNNWAYIFGNMFNDNCTVYFDGTAVDTNYLSFSVEFFPNSLAFRVPTGTPLGSDHQVQVRNAANNRTSNTVTYRIIASRGYRGYHGWKFANFGDPTIPWACYRDFFGASAVEYPNGTHRPAAQAWYNSTYKGVGGGGNCYGMSVSSLRLFNSAMNTLHASWFADPAHHQDYCWHYSWGTQTKQTVQEDQGGQLSAELATFINNYYNNQSHRDVWNRVQSLSLAGGNRPVVCFWRTGGGHATVGYAARNGSNNREIVLWDNNNPYAETETDGPDPNIATVNWAANTYQYVYGTRVYTKAICLSYQECITPPHLPSAATGGIASETAIAVVSANTEVGQITDENGKTFFDADGTPNENPDTRIPNSMQFFPLTGGDAGPDDPEIFFFTHARGKSLTFQLGGTGEKVFRMFMQGGVLSLQAQGSGAVRTEGLATTERALLIPNPAQLDPTRLIMIHSTVERDRAFELNNFQNLGNQSLLLRHGRQGSSLIVRAERGLQCNLILRGPSGQGAAQMQYLDLQIGNNTKAVLEPSNWGNLGASQLGVQLRDLASDQLQQRFNLKGPGG